jgi:hypothetical protein
LPFDYFEVINYRIYFDYVEESMNMYRNAPEPPLHIQHNPSGFMRWVEWASEYKEDTSSGQIAPLGKEFDMEDDIDSFISYYDSLRNNIKGK